jgi:hypothetical protein
MSVIAKILFAPLLAPAWGVCALAERLYAEADASINDEGRGFAELIELGMRHRGGELTDAEFAEQEALVLERLTAIRESGDGSAEPGEEPEDDVLAAEELAVEELEVEEKVSC